MTERQLINALERRGIPSHMHASIIEYVIRGRPVGGFLYHILINDFVRASLRADAHNEQALVTYARFLWWDVPNDCWGSEDEVNGWMDEGGYAGLYGDPDPKPEPDPLDDHGSNGESMDDYRYQKSKQDREARGMERARDRQVD